MLQLVFLNNIFFLKKLKSIRISWEREEYWFEFKCEYDLMVFLKEDEYLCANLLSA